MKNLCVIITVFTALVLCLVRFESAYANTSCSTSATGLPATTYEQQLKWNIFSYNISQDLYSKTNIAWQLKNGTINAFEAENNKIVAAIGVARKLESLTGGSETLTKDALENIGDYFLTLTDDSSTSAEVRAIAYDTVTTLIDSSTNPSAWIGYFSQQIARIEGNIISYALTIDLTREISKYYAINNILYDYYKYHADYDLLNSKFGAPNLTNCNSTDKCFDDFVRMRFNQISLSSCNYLDIFHPIDTMTNCFNSLNQDYVVAEVRKYKDKINKIYNNISLHSIPPNIEKTVMSPSC